MAALKKITLGYPVLKMHGCGNDFVVLYDYDEQLTSGQAAQICSRHFGVGSDGLVTVTRSRIKEAAYRMKFFNPDGSLAEMCGNGIRCFAKYLVDRGLVQNPGAIPVDTDAGLLVPEVLENNPVSSMVKVNMNKPVLHSRDQVNLMPGNDGVVRGKVSGLDFTFVSMGNPHAVIFTHSPEQWVLEYGPGIESNRDMFPQKTNVEFVKVNTPSDLTMRVWERGAGETLACGTGACASLVASVLNGKAANEAVVHLSGGDLRIAWEGNDSPVFMTGKAVNVFEINTDTLDEYLLNT
ncbi:MAG: diaminopimelate epimerase [Spirochaetales bacterium]|nr:diaminopimelate epimerase [Spirochaetales bacterium]